MGWKLIGRLTGIALFLGAFVAANAAPIVPPPDAIARAYAVPSEAVALQAGQDARKHLPALLARLGTDATDAAVRVAVATEAGTISTWVRPVARSQDGFEGELIAPTGALPAGATIPIAADAVRDWHMVDRSGRMYGAFATRILLADLAPSDAAAVRRALTPNPVPTL